MSSKGDKTNFATRLHDVWYLHVIDCNDLTGRFKKFNSDKLNKSLMICSIEILDGLHDSYCFEESELHQGVFNNVLTKQCNLTEINGGMCTDEELFYKACRAGAILGTLQAGYTNFKFISSTSKKIFDREALLGVSITGWMNNPNVLFNKDILEKGASIVKAINEEVAKLIGINPAARTTTVKPSGNACTSFDTKIKTEHGIMSLMEIFNYCTDNEISISNVGNQTWVQPKKTLNVYDENNELKEITNLYVNGVSEIYEIEFEDGNVYEFTGNHKLKTSTGWKFVRDLTDNDEIISL